MKEKMGNNSETSENETSDPHIPQPFSKILRQNASFPPTSTLHKSCGRVMIAYQQHRPVGEGRIVCSGRYVRDSKNTNPDF